VAEEIVGALHAKLLPEQKAQLERKPTQNPGAYDLGQLDGVLEFAPDMLMAGALKAAVHAAWKGETRPVEETLRKVRGKAGEAAIGAWLMFLLDLNPQEALAALDRKEEALREAERAVALLPEARRAVNQTPPALSAPPKVTE